MKVFKNGPKQARKRVKGRIIALRQENAFLSVKMNKLYDKWFLLASKEIWEVYSMLFKDEYSNKSVSDLRQELIDDCYAAAFGGGLGAAILDVPDIEQMSDEEVVREAKRRGLV